MADVLEVDGDVVDWVLKVGGYDIDYMPAYLLQKLSERVERDNNYPKFYRSLMIDYPEECESIVDQGYALPFKYEYTPLMMAVCRNHVSLALKLLDTLPQDSCVMTELLIWQLNNVFDTSEELVKALIGAGAQVGGFV